MLCKLIRKLCPLMSLAIATTGCGKKISDSSPKSSRQTQNQELPSAYVIRLDGSQGSKKDYFMPLPTRFTIPDLVRVRAGSTSGKQVDIVYDANQYDSDDYQFKCTYIPASTPSEMRLKNCVDYDGMDFGDVSSHVFNLYHNDVIQIRFSGAPAPDLIVDAVYSMKWF